jgi:hypothetical protein
MKIMWAFYVLSVFSVSSVLSVSSALVTPLHAQTPTATSTRPVGVGGVVAQVTTGVLGTASGFVGGGLTTRWAARRLGVDEDARGRVALVGAYSSAVLISAVGPALIGGRNTPNGSFAAAVGGSAAGLATAAVLRKLGRKNVFGQSGPVALVVGAAIVALPGIGATIAFNSTR